MKTATRAKRAPLTESKFKLVKLLQEQNIKASLIVQATGLSEATVYRVKLSNDFNHYKKQRREEYDRASSYKEAQAAKQAAQVVELPVEPAPEQPKSFVSPYATKDDLLAIKLQLNDIESKLTDALETFTWVAEHAQIDTAKKRRFF